MPQESTTPFHDATLPGTRRLSEKGDLAALMVAGIGAFLDRETAAADRAAADRLASWPRSRGEHDREVAAARERLARILGVTDGRIAGGGVELAGGAPGFGSAGASGARGGPGVPSLVAETDTYEVHAARWPVLEGVDGEGLLLRPKRVPVACVVALPDADDTPEQAAGLAAGPAASAPPHQPFAGRLAEQGCLVVVPALIDRADTWSGNPAVRMTNQPHREFVYRMAFEMGRHVIGYEVQKVLALVDWFAAMAMAPAAPAAAPPIGVLGYGEGGRVALYSAALDARIDVTCVCGAFGNRAALWREPIYRNVWRLLRGFGDAEVGALVAPRALIVEASAGPAVDGPPPEREGRRGAASGRLEPAPVDGVRAEVERARRVYGALGAADRLRLIEPLAGGTSGSSGAPVGDDALRAFLDQLGVHLADAEVAAGEAGRLAVGRGELDPASRRRRQLDQLVGFTQGLMQTSWRQREALWSTASTASVEAWVDSTAPLRERLWNDVIGRLPPPSGAPDARSRRTYDRPRWTGYDVVLDVYPDARPGKVTSVFAYGVLLVPKDLEAGERRPVVVCQHGLEGRPKDVIEQEKPHYNTFAARLADRGYVVYAPQNPYIGGDTFRQLQRKANPLGWSLFSFIVAQHERTLEWLATLPFVDAERIAFYGLSYGGKTAMRVPALLDGRGGSPGYCLSICAGDFNEWVVKVVSTDLPMSYMFTVEYDMLEFDLGHTFNYAEMAYLIAPRPFMVERGHRDGVALDEWVAFEYAKVRRRYADLGIAGRTQIAFFDAGHMIDGTETFPFLDEHLDWRPRQLVTERGERESTSDRTSTSR